MSYKKNYLLLTETNFVLCRHQIWNTQNLLKNKHVAVFYDYC